MTKLAGIRVFLLIAFLAVGTSLSAQNILYTMPEESAPHEGTWLQWPHNYLYGPWYRQDVEPTWVAMTNALQDGERVHIIAHDSTELSHIKNVLSQASVPMSNIDFFIFQTDDVWVRDNGPIFVYDQNNNLSILDWGFNGWGSDAPFSKCDSIPPQVSQALNLPVVDLNTMVLEGGAIEHNGMGSMLATRSSITHSSRNPSLTETQIEQYLSSYMGITNFIWLDGVYGLEITDMHIDGFARFANDSTILTMNRADLSYWDVPDRDIDTLYAAQDAQGQPFHFSYLPLTQNNVVTAYGKSLGYKGSYINFYIANDVVLVPTYNDPNDSVVLQLVQNLYPNRLALGIDVRNLYEYGGMIHCVTQQQPISLSTGFYQEESNHNILTQNWPNPFSENTTISFQIPTSQQAEIAVYDLLGQMIFRIPVQPANTFVNFEALDFEAGIYIYQLLVNGEIVSSKKMQVNR